MRLLLLNSLFLLAAAGAWAWYHVRPPQPPTQYAFNARPAVPGYQFRNEPLAEEVAKMLATTNLLNGTFYSSKGERVTAFIGAWSAENSKEMSVVSHTPDVCWVGAGWTPVADEHPDQVELEFGPSSLPFECRTFRAPDGNHQELTVWCTLVNGQVYREAGRFVIPKGASGSQQERMAPASRRLAGGQFLNAVRNRTPGTGAKQFVRFSATVAGDWRPVLRELETFGQQWLELTEKRPPVSSER